MSSEEAPTLHDALKKGVWKEHEEAENGVFTQAIMKGSISREAYRQFLVEVREVYIALEEMGELNKDHPDFGPIYFPTELNRLIPLEEDIEYFYGPDWRDQVKPMTKGSKAYADRIREVGKTDPILLVAHSYVRYLGDMSGGQQLKYKISKTLGLPESGDGVHFFKFNEIDNIGKFKNFYFGNLNSIETKPGDTEKLVKEARQAFVFNINLFGEMTKVAEMLKPKEAEAAAAAADENPSLLSYITNGVHKIMHKS